MNDVVSNLLSQGTVYLMLICVIVTFFVRKGVEVGWPKLKKQAHANAPEITYASKMAEVWHTLILRAIPLVTGAALGVWYIEVIHGDMKQMGSRVLFGSIAGFFASGGYKAVRMAFFKKTGVKLPGGSVLPLDNISGPPPPAG